MRQLVVRSVAEAELAEAVEWYAGRSPGTARRFLAAVDEALARIRQNPGSFPVVHGQLRRVLVAQFPYAVYYRMFPTTISIVGVVHGRRHPRHWRRRG
ncbi:MAG: type II toxin-antitoxin system RelE/ParE family toxin [Gemmatimonadales bacterium]